MSYNNRQFQAYLNTAGKITVLTALAGVIIFTLVFLLNIGAKEFNEAVAQDIATTSVTVLNTPPNFDVEPFEDPGSATTSPTNSGDQVTWKATATDSNGEDWFLLVCDGNATPTAQSDAPPECGGSDLLYGVSATTTSGSEATVSTTTTEAMPESNDWYAWACDSTTINPRCTSSPSQGATPGATSSSPFNVNHRPSFTGYWDDSPADPGATVTFYATSTDSDTVGGQDTLRLFVCNTNSFNSTSSLGCNGTELASSTFPVHPNATSTYTIASIRQDDDYFAYGFVVDNHGHEASGGSQGTDSVLTVNNVAPTVSEATIDLNGGVDMTLVEGVETSDTAFTLDFVVTDNNSCDAVGGGNNDEFSTSTISVYRSGVGSTTCDGTAGVYDPNNCYPNGVNSSTWNIQCTASSTTCSGSSDSTMTVECTFPLWFIADPTNGATASDTVYFNEDWRAAVSATDDDNATSTFTEGQTITPEVIALTALDLLDATIPYGALEPGNDTGSTNASTTVESTGNTGLDEEISGESMCTSYSTGSTCPNSSTSTIPAAEQEFATSTFTYGNGVNLSSTTPRLALLNVAKTTSTTTPNSKETYWGIRVPGSITLAGSYTGENTISAQMSDPSFW